MPAKGHPRDLPGGAGGKGLFGDQSDEFADQGNGRSAPEKGRYEEDERKQGKCPLGNDERHGNLVRGWCCGTAPNRFVLSMIAAAGLWVGAVSIGGHCWMGMAMGGPAGRMGAFCPKKAQEAR